MCDASAYGLLYRPILPAIGKALTMRITQKDIRNADRLIRRGWKAFIADGVAIEYARAEFSFYSAKTGKLLARTLADWQPMAAIMADGSYRRANDTSIAKVDSLAAYDEKTDDTVRASGAPGSSGRKAALAAFYADGASAERTPFRDISADRLAALLAASARSTASSAMLRRLSAEKQAPGELRDDT